MAKRNQPEPVPLAVEFADLIADFHLKYDVVKVTDEKDRVDIFMKDKHIAHIDEDGNVTWTNPRKRKSQKT